MKKIILSTAILVMLVISAFAMYQPAEIPSTQPDVTPINLVEESTLPPTITFDPAEYDETYGVVTYGSAYYVTTANAFCNHMGQGNQAGYSIAPGTVDGTYAWYQTSWYIGHDEGGKLFDSITCFKN